MINPMEDNTWIDKIVAKHNQSPPEVQERVLKILQDKLKDMVVESSLCTHLFVKGKNCVHCGVLESFVRKQNQK